MHLIFVAIMSWDSIGQAASAAVLDQSHALNRDPVEIAPVPLIVVQRIMPCRPVVPHREIAIAPTASLAFAIRISLPWQSVSLCGGICDSVAASSLFRSPHDG